MFTFCKTLKNTLKTLIFLKTILSCPQWHLLVILTRGPQIQGKPGLHSEFEACLSYMVRPFQKTNKRSHFKNDHLTSNHAMLQPIIFTSLFPRFKAVNPKLV